MIIGGGQWSLLVAMGILLSSGRLLGGQFRFNTVENGDKMGLLNDFKYEYING
jgi:hypothetical protein